LRRKASSDAAMNVTRKADRERGGWGAGISGVTAGLSLFLAWLAERRYRRLPPFPAELPAGPLPSLSIVIPARNEAHNLPRLLRSLHDLCYDGPLEIIVVDDGSGDNTADVAESYGARVLRLPGPPPGWSGKAYACHRGAALAQGEWLLFTDADTVHTPTGPARAVALAQAEGWDGLSLFLANESQTIAVRLALMVAHAGYFAGLGDSRGALNGQYVLLHRRVYKSSGGFAAVRREITEDLALGHLLAEQGYHVPLLRGDDAGQVHMYRDVRQMWLGLARFAVTSLRWSGTGSLLAVLYTIVLAAPLELLLAATVRRQPRWPVLATWLAAAAGLFPWARRFGGGLWAGLAPLGALLVQFAAIWGILQRLAGRGVRWKERVL